MPWVKSHVTHDLTYTGKYGDLKPRGFTFHKLFASNYIAYRKGDLWLWRIDRMVEFGHASSHTGAIFAWMLARNFTWKDPNAKDPDANTELAIDLATGTIDYYDRERHENWCIYKDLPMSERNDQPTRYVRIWIDDALVADVKQLYDEGLLQLTERPHA